MTKASEEKLGELHGVVAKALTGIIEEGTSVVIGKGEDAVVEKVTAPASYFAAAIALLKNNNITADPTRNADLAELEKTLSAARQSRKSNLLTNQQALADFEAQLGGMTDGT